MKKTVSIISLGCFRNTYDSEVVLGDFIRQGYLFTEKTRVVDVLVVNTCGFISDAKEESLRCIEEVLMLKKQKKVKKIVIIGCLVQRYQEKLRKYFPQVDQWQGVQEFNGAYPRQRILLPSHIAFLKICEGCINNCSYCAIPKIKGKLKSRAIDEVLSEAEFLDKKGIKELNIIGQDVTSWGKDLYKGKDLSFLLKRILKETKDIPWLRILYTHPKNFSDSLIDLIGCQARICKYIDLPIQHINDRILKMMNRKITKNEIIRLIKKIRRRIPEAVIRTSVMVGFPTETNEEFKELFEFVKETKFQHLGVFIYSREEETPAYDLKPQIAAGIKKKRYDDIMKLQRGISAEFKNAMIGKAMQVLVDKKQGDYFIGRSQFCAYDIDGVIFLRNRRLKPGNFCKTKVIDAYEYDLLAR